MMQTRTPSETVPSRPAAQRDVRMMDDTNHDVIHALSVKLDSTWHDRSYHDETNCDGCRRVFERVRELDEKAVKLLSDELAVHVRANKFPIDLTD